MRSSKLLLGVLIMGAGVLAMSASALASVMNMSTVGGPTLLFYDDFEDATSVSHAAYPDTSAYFWPTGGTPGTWNCSADAKQVQVTDITNGPNGPGTLQGNNYLRLQRGLEADFSAGQLFTVQDKNGDHIHWEQMLYAGSAAANANPVQLLGDGTDGRRFNILTSYSPAGGSVGSYTGDWPPGAIAGLSYVANTWQKWELDYNIGDTVIKLTIDGVSASNIPIMSGGNLGAISLVSSSIAYADEVSVPEPSMVALLVTGLFGLLCYAWRKRK